jgi:DNA primase
MSGLIPQTFIDELLNQTDIVELIDSFVPLKKRGKSHIACCPFHQEKSPSFNVVSKKQFYHCFGCGASGNAISFVMNYQHINFVEAIQQLAQRLGLSIPQANKTEKTQTSLNYSQLLGKVCIHYQQTLKTSPQAIAYLKGRKITGEIAKTFQLGFAPDGWQFLETTIRGTKAELIATGMLVPKENGSSYDRYRNRIMFPIHDRHGKIIGFGGRSIDKNHKPKYLNSPETVLFQKNRELYGLYQALQHTISAEYIIIVEGYLDVIALAQASIGNVVATLGTATSTYHIQLLRKYTKKIIFCFDGDEAGNKAAWRALENSLSYLNTDLEITFCFLPEGEDPDSIIRQDQGKRIFEENLEKSLSFHQYFFNSLKKNVDLSKMAGRGQFVNLTKPYLEKIPPGAYRELVIEELGRYTRIELHRLNALLEEKKFDKLKGLDFSIARSPLRVVIALLLQNPEIFTVCQAQIKQYYKDIKNRIFRKIIQLIAENPAINTAKLVESWRNSSAFESINKLAFWDHQVPEQALQKEFIDILRFLARQDEEGLVQELLVKAREQGLNDEERIQLQAMLKQRHRADIAKKDSEMH